MSSSTSLFGHALVGVGRARLEQQRVAGAQRLLAQDVGEVDDALLVGVADDQRAVAALEDLLEHDDLAGALEAARGDDVHRLVEHDLLAVLQLVDVDLGRDRDAQLAAGGEDVDGAVVERLEEHAVAARRLGEPVDLLLERDHLVARLAQRVGEPVVAVVERGDAGLGLGEAVFEHAHVARRFGDLARAAARVPARGTRCGGAASASLGRTRARIGLRVRAAREPCGHLPDSRRSVRENPPYTRDRSVHERATTLVDEPIEHRRD